MKRRPLSFTALPFALCALAFGACSSSSESPPKATPPADRTVVVLFTSDEHSHVFSFSPELDDFPSATAPGSGALIGGVARRAALIAKERGDAKTAGKDLILVSAGDNQMGALPHVAFETASVDYGTMKALGYDATALGNHEFDFGPKALVTSINAAKAAGGLPPIVSSNIHFSDTSPDDDELAKLYSTAPGDTAAIHPYQVLTTSGGLKIGVIGLVGINAAHVAPNKTPVAFSALGVDPKKEGDLLTVLPKTYADLQPWVDKLRNDEKVDLVIALSHSGLDMTSPTALAASEDYMIAANVKGIDLIVSGHVHSPDPTPTTVKNTKGGPDTLVLNGSSFGRHVGRVELTVHADGRPVDWNKGTQKLLPVDDATVPDAASATKLTDLVAQIEKSPDNGDGKPYLEKLLSNVEGSAVKDDATKSGDLYFRPIGKTGFDVTDIHSLLALSSDAMLAAADAEGIKADFALESAGVIRGKIKKGKTGVISAADAFSIVPLGSSPGNGTMGYPMIATHVFLYEMRGIFEFALTLGPTSDDYDLLAAGVHVEFDNSRPPVKVATDILNKNKGWVMKISVDSDHTDGFDQYDKLIYDRTNNVGNDNDLISAVTSSYIAQFASDVGIHLKDAAGKPMAPVVKDAIVKSIITRPDLSELKQLEAFLGYIKAAPGGTLASTYDAASPMAAKHFVCVAAAGCP